VLKIIKIKRLTEKIVNVKIHFVLKNN
jgi:hypothetical protein